MSKLSPNIVKKQLEVIQDNYDDSIDKLAQEVRTHFVIPICRQYGLRFLSGNGTYCFYYNKHTQIGDIEEAERIFNRSDFEDVFKVLELSVGRFNLGDYVESVYEVLLDRHCRQNLLAS